MKAVIYARKSTKNPGQTFDIQLQFCNEWAEKNHVDVVHTFKDSLSGKKTDRPGLQNALWYIAGYNMENESDPITYIIIQSPDRLTRDFRHLVDLYTKLKSNKVSIVWAMDDSIVSDSNKLMDMALYIAKSNSVVYENPAIYEDFVKLMGRCNTGYDNDDRRGKSTVVLRILIRKGINGG